MEGGSGEGVKNLQNLFFTVYWCPLYESVPYSVSATLGYGAVKRCQETIRVTFNPDISRFKFNFNFFFSFLELYTQYKQTLCESFIITTKRPFKDNFFAHKLIYYLLLLRLVFPNHTGWTPQQRIKKLDFLKEFPSRKSNPNHWIPIKISQRFISTKKGFKGI